MDPSSPPKRSMAQARDEQQLDPETQLKAAQTSAALFLVSSLAQLLTAYGGFQSYTDHGYDGIRSMLSGGHSVPYYRPVAEGKNIEFSSMFNATGAGGGAQLAYRQLFFNHMFDVGAFGVLGLFVAYKIWSEASVLAYWLGLVPLGISQAAYVYSMLYPNQVIPWKLENLIGPLSWLAAVIVGSFGVGDLAEEFSRHPYNQGKNLKKSS